MILGLTSAEFQCIAVNLTCALILIRPLYEFFFLIRAMRQDAEQREREKAALHLKKLSWNINPEEKDECMESAFRDLIEDLSEKYNVH